MMSMKPFSCWVILACILTHCSGRRTSSQLLHLHLNTCQGSVQRNYNKIMQEMNVNNVNHVFDELVITVPRTSNASSRINWIALRFAEINLPATRGCAQFRLRVKTQSWVRFYTQNLDYCGSLRNLELLVHGHTVKLQISLFADQSAGVWPDGLYISLSHSCVDSQTATCAGGAHCLSARHAYSKATVCLNDSQLCDGVADCPFDDKSDEHPLLCSSKSSNNESQLEASKRTPTNTSSSSSSSNSSRQETEVSSSPSVGITTGSQLKDEDNPDVTSSSQQWTTSAFFRGRTSTIRNSGCDRIRDFLCISSDSCIDAQLRCNGQADCPGNEDEMNCARFARMSTTTQAK